MATVDLTRETFEDTVKRDGITLVDWWAAWCGPCRMFAPVFEAASEQHPDIVFAKIDTEAEQGLAAAARIMSIPTLMAFRDGILVFSQPGALPGEALEMVIQAVRDLDMDDVRRQIAHAEAHPDEIGLDEFAAAHASGAYVLDVREDSEFTEGHVPGAVHIPMNEVPQRLAELPEGEHIHVICAVGSRSRQVVDYLQGQGIDAVNVSEGTAGWAQRGWPLER